MMGMPLSVEVIDTTVEERDIEAVFEYYNEIDKIFSTYKTESEISKINRGDVLPNEYGKQMKEVFAMCEETKKLTDGYFDIRRPDGKLDPSGLVKGWMINNAAQILLKKGFKSFYVEIAGDIQTHGINSDKEAWRIGIRNPFNTSQIVKIVKLSGQGIATSGNYERGDHIWGVGTADKKIASVSIIGPNVYEADRFATAVFAMGEKGILFVEKYRGLEGYIIDSTGRATMTSGFEKYL